MAIAAIILSIFNVNKPSIIISIVLFIFSICPIGLGMFHYKHLSDSGISFSEMKTLEQKDYGWDEVEKVVYHLEKEKGERSNIEIQFIDGDKLMIANDGEFTANYYWFRKKLDEYDIEFVGDKAER